MVETTATAAGGRTNFVLVKSDNFTKVEILKYLDELHGNLLEAIAHGISLNQSGKLFHLSGSDIQQILLTSTHSSGAVLCVRNMLLENAIRLEKSAGFSSLISTLFVVNAVKMRMREFSSGKTINIDISQALHELTRASRRASRDIAFKAIKQYCKDSLASSIIIQACSMAGHSGHIYIDNTPSALTSIELTNGYTFQFGIEKNFCLGTKTHEWKVSNPKVLLIDGIIETVGEINRLLEYMHENKQSCVIMARGFSNEVLGTLSANKARGTLDVIPVLVPFDLEGINAIVDLAVVCQTEIVSSLKGDAISAVDPQKLKSVESIKISGLNTVIQNSVADSYVRAHINDIISRKDETEITDKKDLFDKRTRSLSSVCTHVRISGNDLGSKNTKRRIQHGTNLLKHICQHGCINLNEVKKIGDKTIQRVVVELIDSGYENVSANEFIIGLKCGETLANNIFSSSVYLVLDSKK